jgi:protein-disulfide isomerase
MSVLQPLATGSLKTLVDEYVSVKKVRVAVRHLPLEGIHKFARRAAEGAECARTSGKFWPFHDALFAALRPLDDAKMAAAADASGIELSGFSRCLADVVTRRAVARDIQEAQTLSVTTTPTTFVGTFTSDGKMKVNARLAGAVSFDRLRSAVETALAAVTPQ